MRSVTANILCWNTPDIVIESINRLAKEVLQIVVVDNGSHNSAHLENMCAKSSVEYVKLNKNRGFSIGKNIGITLSRCQDIFLLNGDILYVPGTINEYQKILNKYPRAACVGMFDTESQRCSGMLGTQYGHLADKVMQNDYLLTSYWPLSWPHYGLYRGDVLKAIPLPDFPPFDVPGHGYDDDYHYYMLKQAGWDCLAVNRPIYYHDQFYSALNLSKTVVAEGIIEQRKQLLKDHYNVGNWLEELEKLKRAKIISGKEYKVFLERP